jgi:DNA-binding MarR family transcriptional regulator
LALEYKSEGWLSLDLSISQLKSLVYINVKEKVSFKELAGALNVAPSVVTGIADRLILRGMVERKQEAASRDRRVQWLVVTEKGRALLDNIRQQISEDTSEILDTMNTDDLSALIQGLSALIEASELYLKKQHTAVKV